MRVLLLLAAVALVGADTTHKRPSKGYGPPPKYSDDRLDSGGDVNFPGARLGTGNGDLGNEFGDLGTENGDFTIEGDSFSTEDGAFTIGGDFGTRGSDSTLGDSDFRIGDGDFSAEDDTFGIGEGDNLVIESDSLAIAEESGTGLESSRVSSRPRRYRWFLSFIAPSTSRRRFTWREAARQCARRGLVLLSIENARKDRMVKRVLRRYNIRAIWTSGTRRGRSFSWVNGTPIGGRYYSNWDFTGSLGRPQPDNASGREDCVGVLNNIYSRDVKWHDLVCNFRLYFICERP